MAERYYAYTLEPEGIERPISGNLYCYTNMPPKVMDACVLNWAVRRKHRFRSRILYARSLMNYVDEKRRRRISDYALLIYTTPQK